MEISKGRLAPILKQKTYATFDGAGTPKSLPGLCFELLSEQEKVWLDLFKGYESLKDLRERNISCSGFSVRLQHNPGRIKSSTADVTGKNANERRCFLCLNHLPEEQKGILYRSDYLILCNPMPILTAHLTVSQTDHRHQAVDEHIDAFLRLMVDLGPGWMVLYNGPKCGASAPDHLHFQAALSGQVPIEKDIREQKRLVLAKQMGAVLLYRVKGLGREVMMIEGDDPVAVGAAFNGLLKALKKSLLLSEEPMLNIVGFYEERRWRLVIFPRRKHRPDAFFKEGNDRVVVSPGVIDMAGVLVTPVEKDFDRLDAAAVEGIYKEVTLEEEVVEKTLSALSIGQRA